MLLNVWKLKLLLDLFLQVIDENQNENPKHVSKHKKELKSEKELKAKKDSKSKKESKLKKEPIIANESITDEEAMPPPKKKKKRTTKKSTVDKLWFEPERILGATDNWNGQMAFRFKVKDSDRIERVPAKVANVFCPQIVIDFYEKHLVFFE